MASLSDRADKLFDRRARVEAALKKARKKVGLVKKVHDTQTKAVPRGNAVGRIKAARRLKMGE